ncbi:MAG: hypothetical protein EOO47_23880 [Flavobacterium sp.]|nr:MAG: hypothetical protein EOO47_23880 [Flavobacterium sp.]
MHTIKRKSAFFKMVMILVLGISTQSYGQVGVNTTTPKATLDITGIPTNATVPDGIIAPRLTGDELKAKDNVYTANQTGTLLYVTAAATAPTTPKTVNVTRTGYYMFDGTAWIYSFGNSNIGITGNTDLSGVLVQVNQSGYTTLSGTQSYGLLLQNAGLTISPQYDLGTWSSTTQNAGDVISSNLGEDGALLIETTSQGQPTFYRIGLEYVMGNNPPAQTTYFTVDILDNDTGGHIFSQSIVVPGGLNTGHVAPFSLSFNSIPDTNANHLGYKIIFSVDTGSQGLANNISVKMNQILKID